MCDEVLIPLIAPSTNTILKLRADYEEGFADAAEKRGVIQIIPRDFVWGTPLYQAAVVVSPRSQFSASASVSTMLPD